MDILTAEQLIALSNNAFFDNDQGQIDPSEHRAFNEALIYFTLWHTTPTFVVDSDDALRKWAQGVTDNDYTSVLIRPGTWTSSMLVNLTNAGTKVVKGMPGSLLSFSSQYGLKYNTAPSSPVYWMDGVSVTTAYSGGTSTGVNAFENCVNLNNCTGNSKNTNGTNYSYGFYGCKNLINCKTTEQYSRFANCENLVNCKSDNETTENSGRKPYAFINCKRLLHCSVNSVFITAFDNCEYLTSCYASGAPIQGPSLTLYTNCKHLTNCYGESVVTTLGGATSSLIFSNCKKLNNCYGYSSMMVSGVGIIAYSFSNCKDLENCAGVAEASGGSSRIDIGNGNYIDRIGATAYAFMNCTGLVNCEGSGVATELSTTYNFSTGCGFRDCRIMTLCHPGDTPSTTDTYLDCYMHATDTDDPVGDTAAGGWNRG